MTQAISTDLEPGEVLREPHDLRLGGRDCNCIQCGRSIWLYYNGGELDRRLCCGMLYSLEIVAIHYVVREGG